MDETSLTSYCYYIDQLRRNLKTAYEKAQAISEAHEQRNRRKYNPKVRIQDLQLGDQVLLQNLNIPGKHKLADWWSSQPYIIIEKLRGLPVYWI